MFFFTHPNSCPKDVQKGTYSELLQIQVDIPQASQFFHFYTFLLGPQIIALEDTPSGRYLKH